MLSPNKAGESGTEPEEVICAFSRLTSPHGRVSRSLSPLASQGEMGSDRFLVL